MIWAIEVAYMKIFSKLLGSTKSHMVFLKSLIERLLICNSLPAAIFYRKLYIENMLGRILMIPPGNLQFLKLKAILT